MGKTVTLPLPKPARPRGELRLLPLPGRVDQINKQRHEQKPRDPTISYIQKTHFKYNMVKLKGKGWKKIYHVNINLKKKSKSGSPNMR